MQIPLQTVGNLTNFPPGETWYCGSNVAIARSQFDIKLCGLMTHYAK